MTPPLTEQERAEDLAVLRGILNDYQLNIAGPDVDRGIAAIARLDQRITNLTRERDAAELRTAQELKIVIKRGLEIDRQMRRAEAAEAQLAVCREALREIIEEFRSPASETGYEEDDPVVIIARRALSDGGSDCEHEWVDARNEAVESGQVCGKCHAIRATPVEWPDGDQVGQDTC